MARLVHAHPVIGSYRDDQDLNLGCSVSRIRLVFNLMKADSLALPLGFALELRMRDGYVLCAHFDVSRVTEDERGVFGSSLHVYLTEDGLSDWVRRRFRLVQQVPKHHRPYRGTHLDRARDQYDGYLMSSLGTDPPECIPQDVLVQAGITERLNCEEAVERLPLLVQLLAQRFSVGGRISFC